MRITRRMRAGLHRIFAWAERATSQMQYSSDPDYENASYRMRHPHYFPDIESFATFLARLRSMYPDATSMTVREIDLLKDPVLQVARQVAELPKPQRTNLYITVNRPIGSITFAFQQKVKGFPARTNFGGGMTAQILYQLISETCSIMPRRVRKIGSPLIEPIHSGDETRNRIKLEVASRASRSGAIAGFVTSLVVTVITLAGTILMGGF